MILPKVIIKPLIPSGKGVRRDSNRDSDNFMEYEIIIDCRGLQSILNLEIVE